MKLKLSRLLRTSKHVVLEIEKLDKKKDTAGEKTAIYQLGKGEQRTVRNKVMKDKERRVRRKKLRKRSA